jgi:hypothetical protein
MMLTRTRIYLSSIVVGGLLLAGCAPGGSDGTPGTGGATAGTTGAAGTTGSAAGTMGSGAGTTGSGAGTTGSGGTTTGVAGTTGAAGSAAGTGGAAAGTGGGAGAAGGAGGAAGRGGTTGTGGRGGTTGTGGRGGTTGAAGRGGTTGAGGQAGSGAAGAGAGDAYVSGVNIAVHPQTNTILVVTWTQAMAAEQTFLEFSFAGSSVMTSRPLAGATGAHRDVVLGVPGSTAVTVRIVSRQGGVDYKTRDYMGMTAAIPAGMPLPTVLSYDAAGASPDRWMFGSVENSSGGCTNRNCYFDGLFWVYIMDRQGRIVWYYSDAASNAATGFQRIARDGEYIWIDKARTGTRGVVKMTLDRQYMQTIAAPIADAIDVTDDGSLLYDTNGELRELTRAGTTRSIWSCRTAFGASYNCYSNTINWDKASDTVLMSFPEPNTVVQIQRANGTIVATYGDRAGSYAFSPSSWSFEWQHFPNISDLGTLMVSSHLPMFPEGSSAGPMQHAFIEFTIDRTNNRLVEKWSYSAGTEWALSRGMAIRLPNGNVLGNYGTGGAIREITPDKRTVFHVKFDVQGGSDYANKMVGHNVLINDLYALNGGGPR